MHEQTKHWQLSQQPLAHTILLDGLHLCSTIHGSQLLSTHRLQPATRKNATTCGLTACWAAECRPQEEAQPALWGAHRVSESCCPRLAHSQSNARQLLTRPAVCRPEDVPQLHDGGRLRGVRGRGGAAGQHQPQHEAQGAGQQVEWYYFLIQASSWCPVLCVSCAVHCR